MFFNNHARLLCEYLCETLSHLGGRSFAYETGVTHLVRVWFSVGFLAVTFSGFAFFGAGFFSVSDFFERVEDDLSSSGASSLEPLRILFLFGYLFFFRRPSSGRMMMRRLWTWTYCGRQHDLRLRRPQLPAGV